MRFLSEEIGNPASRSHEFGTRAKQAVEQAREQVAEVVNASREEVIFTSGATESNNLAILGLAAEGERTGRKHLVSTQIEHKAVLEPLDWLTKRGFELTRLPPNPGGWVEPEQIKAALRPHTLLVSVMHVNNETGVVQPIGEIAEILTNHTAFFHVDAAQGFGKQILPLRSTRLDLISISGHKIYGPKGVGALVARRRGFDRIPLTPLMVGGGQERGLRPGTLPVPLIVGLGKAAEIALKEAHNRAGRCIKFRKKALGMLELLKPIFNGDQTRTLPHVLNISIPSLDSEAVMVALKELVAVSNGSACTSASYEPSHVLKAMGLGEDTIRGAIRISWCHMTEDPDWKGIRDRIDKIR
jgi:cysteine desulfurase